MNLTDEIRNFDVTEPLSSEDHKTCREYEALAMLKFLLSEQFSSLRKSEAPDLQDTEHSLGVEVTWGGSQDDELISGESIKYSRAKTDEEREKILNKIREHGGDRNEISTTYPVGTSEKDKVNIEKAFRKKLKKAEKYRKKFDHLGVVIMVDIPMIFFDVDFDWRAWFSEINERSSSKYDFVVLSHWSGISLYDFKTREYIQKWIDREDRRALCKLARMATEGIIKDNDPVWSNLQNI